MNSVGVLVKRTNSIVDAAGDAFFLLEDTLDLLGIDSLACPAAEEGQQEEEGGLDMVAGHFYHLDPVEGGLDHAQVVIVVIILD